MVDILDQIGLSFTDFLLWYSADITTGSFFEFFLKQIANYFLLQGIFYLIPFLKRVIVVFFLPFRWIHVHLHMYSVKTIFNEIDVCNYQKSEKFLLENDNPRVSLITGVDITDKYPGLLMSFSKFGYARRVAFAPNKLAFSMVLGYFIATPFLLTESSIFSPLVGAIFHLYLFIGIFGILMPSINDWYFLIQSLTMNTRLRPIWYYNSLLVYLIFTFDTLIRTHNFFLSILNGTIWFVLYIVGLFIIGYLAKENIISKFKILCMSVGEYFSKSKQKIRVGVSLKDDIDN
ncbi:MAG: hypothetical protein ACW99A_18690 [Candidatus Kariarchaeaceae archaeon]